MVKNAGGGGRETSVTARIVMPLLAVMLIATACQTTASEPENVSTTAVIENTTIPSTTTMAPDEATVASTAEPQPIHPVQVVCSTELAAFPCSALIDGSLESEWQAPNCGIEARIAFAFDRPYQITEIGFANLSEEERFLRNGKIKDVSVALDDLLQVTYIRLDDDNAAIQWFPVRSLRTTILTVTVTAAYPGISVGESGPSFAELALAEVEFRGIDARDVPPTTTEWQFTGLVIDDQGTKMCPESVMDSRPPQCVGVPIDFFDWTEISEYEEAAGVRWVDVTLVGTLSDDGVFRLTQPPISPQWPPEIPSTPIPLPCEEPEDGWRIINPATADNITPAVQYAQAQPEFMGNWNYRLPDGAVANSVKVFTFSGNLAGHEAALRNVYGGPLCVSLADRSLAELEAIRNQVKEAIVSEEAAGVGIHLLNGQYGDTIDVILGTVEFNVLAAEPGAGDWLSRHFDEGVVNLHSLLQRVGDAG